MPHERCRCSSVAVVLSAAVLAIPAFAAGQDDPETPRSPVAARLAGVAEAAGLSVVFDPPSSATPRRFGWLSFERADRGRAIWMHDPDEPYGFVAPALPPGARLLPVIDASWLDDAGIEPSPTTVALVVPGTSYAWVGGTAVRLERAPATSPHAAALDDRSARAATVGLRARATCAGGAGSCLLYGPPDDVLAAREPLEASYGWTLERVRPPRLPASLPTRRRAIVRGDVALESDRYEPTIVAYDWASNASPHRVWLVVGGRRIHAFDLAFFPALDGDHRLVPFGRELLVVVGDGSTLGVSRHDARTGERLGPPVLVRSKPHFHVCDDHDVLVPVPTQRAMGFALVNVDGPDRAVYFPVAGAAGRVVPVQLGEAAEEAALPKRYALAGRGLVPVLEGP